MAITLEADAAREKYKKIRARFRGEPPRIEVPGVLDLRRSGRDLEIVANGASEQILEQLRAHSPESVSTEALTLEDIFMVSLQVPRTSLSAVSPTFQSADRSNAKA